MPIKNIIPRQKVTKEKLNRSRELRLTMTPATPSALRDKALSELGLRTLRFRNEEILIDMPQVALLIRALISIQ